MPAAMMKLKRDMDTPADREKLRRAVLDLVAGRKMPKQKGAALSRCLLFSRCAWSKPKIFENFVPQMPGLVRGRP